MKPSHVFVTAAAGRLCPIAATDATAPGGLLLKCEPGKLYRIPYSTHTRRRIIAGDLILCNARLEEVAEVENAAAPDALPLRDDGSVAPLELETPAPTSVEALAPLELETLPAPSASPASSFDTTDTAAPVPAKEA